MNGTHGRDQRTIKEVVKDFGIDFIFGGHTQESIILQEQGYRNVLASPVPTLKVVKNKFQTYTLFSEYAPEFS